MVKGYSPPIPLKGPIFSYGKNGSGKTFKNLAITQFYHSKGYKIFDIFGGLRREGPFWCFPSDEKVLWRSFLKEAGLSEYQGPKEYKIDLYSPFFKSKIPNKIPEKLPRIQHRLFTLDFKSIKINDVAALIGGVTNNQERILKRIKDELPDFANGQDILNWFDQTAQRKKMKRFPIYYAFFEPLCRENLLEGPKGKYIINLKEIAEDKERIFVLDEDYIPEEKYRYFFILYFIRNLFELVNDSKIPIYNITLLREINSFMKTDDNSIQYREQKQIVRNEFSNLLRYGRSGVFPIVDTQSPSEVRGITPGQEGLICLSILPGDKDREEACDRPRRDGRMNSTHVAYIGTMPVHEMAVLEMGKPIKKIDRVQPPRTMGWTPEKGTFLKVWKEKYNEFKDTREIIKDIDNLYNDRKIINNEINRGPNDQDTKDKKEVDLDTISKKLNKDKISNEEEIEFEETNDSYELEDEEPLEIIA